LAAPIVKDVEAIGGPDTQIGQVLCTEYDEGVWVSAGTATSSGFRRAGGEKWERFTLEAQPRSLYMISGASRQVWEHSIPTVEAPRYSITLEPWSGERRDPWTPPDRLRLTEDSESNGKPYRQR
jgi:hypothetical protein